MAVIRQKVKPCGNEVSCVATQSKEGNCVHCPEQVKGWSTRSLRAGQGMTKEPFLTPVVRPYLKALVLQNNLKNETG
jgi:hypothetical protein